MSTRTLEAPLMLFALLAPACVVVHELTDEDSFTSDSPVTALVLDSDSGDVRIVGTDAATATVTRTLHWTGDDQGRPRAEADVTGETLTVRSECGDLAMFCGVTWEIALPRAAELQLDLGSGDVELSDLAGTVTLRLGSGDVTLAGLAGPVDVDTGSGDLALGGLSGAVTVSTGSGDVDGHDLAGPTCSASTDSGDVRLAFSPEAPLTELDVESGSGDIDLATPAGAWDLDVWTASGDVSVFGVDDDSAAGRHLTAHTGSGDIGVVGG